MKNFVYLFFYFMVLGKLYAQPKLELLPHGFEPVTVDIPEITSEKFIDLAKNWAVFYNRNGNRYDVSEVTSNTITVSALKKNAFFYRNKGETFNYNIEYDVKLNFYGNYYTLLFIVKNIYTDDNVLIQSSISDYFDSNGNLKEGFNEVKPSLEKNVNGISKSLHNYITNYR